MRHQQPSLHVTQETKLSLPVQVEIETSDSFVSDGVRIYVVGSLSNKTLIPRATGCLLEKLRYRFYAGAEGAETILSPWDCRNNFLRNGVTLRECAAGLSAKTVGKGKTAALVTVRPEGNPTHSWALGLFGVLGSFLLGKMQPDSSSTLSASETALDIECSEWRALLRNALQIDYADWTQLAAKHPAEWVDELLSPLPLRTEARDGAPVARVVCQSLLDVLIVTTQLDGIRRLRQRVCKAEGCGEMFAVGNYDHKLFCNNECAHRQAVRDGRRRKREAIEKARSKAKKAATKGRTAK